MIRFEKETRYYTIRLEQDLLDDWVVVTIHGRINSKLGQNKLVAFDEFEQAHTHFKKICTIRQKRHYQIIEQNNRPFSSQKNNKTNQSLHPTFFQKEKNKNKLDENFYINGAQNSFLNQLFDL